MKKSEQLQKLIALGRPFSTKEAFNLGLSAPILAYYCKAGRIERLSRGIYTAQGAEQSQFIDIQVLTKKNINFVVCLLSALQIHELTTQLPHSLWVAVPQHSRISQLDSLGVEYIQFTEKPYSYGVEKHELDGVTVNVYSAAKTIADCFKFRNKIGLDVALEALKEGHQKKLFTNDELYNAAKVCRVEKIIRPYQELLLT